MRLLNLELQNWSCHDSRDIDLSQSLQIEGRNGTGKSSILEAIRFIFSKSALGYNNKIKNGTRFSRVALKFEKDKNIYLVEKELYIDKPSTAQMLCNSNIIADNPKSVYNALQNILSEDILDKLLYVSQGELTRMIDELHRKGGRQELDALFGLDKFELIYTGIGEEIKENQIRLDEKHKLILRYPEKADEEYKKRIDELNLSNENLRNELNKKELELEDINSKTLEINEKIINIQNLKKQIDNLQKEINDLNINIVGYKKEIESISQNLSGIREKRNELIELKRVGNELKKYVPIRDLLLETIRNKERLSDIEDIGEYQKKVEKIKTELRDKDKIEREYSESEKLLSKCDVEIAKKSYEIEELNNYVKSLKELDGTPKCPRCGQRLTKTHLKRELDNASVEINTLNKDLKKLRIISESQKSRHDELKKVLTNLQEKGIELKNILDLISKKKTQQDLIKKFLWDLDGKLAKLRYSGEPIKSVEDKIRTLNEISGKINIIEREIQNESEYSRKKRGLEITFFDSNQRLKKCESDLSSMKYDPAEFDNLNEKRDELRENYYKLSSDIREFKSKIDENNRIIQDTESLRGDYIKIKSDVEALENRVKLLNASREIFHTDKGLPKFLRDKYVDQLSILLTHYFKNFNQNPIYSDILFDENYDICVKTTTGNLTTEQLSGGEKVQLATALRIALIELLSPTRLLILDEPFGSLDHEHREILGESLNKVAGDGQLILVTHVHVYSLQLPEKLELIGY